MLTCRINAFADEDIKREYVPRLCTGEFTGAMVLTEPDAGSDLQSVKTVGYQDAEGKWYVNGVKRFITNGCGDVLLVERTQNLENETYGELSARLSTLGAKLIVEALRALKSGEYTLTPQSKEGVQIVRKIDKEHAKIDFRRSVKEVCNLVRAMNPAPIAHTLLNGGAVNVYRAEKAELIGDEAAAFADAACGEVLSEKPKRGLLVKCADGAVRLLELQGAGGKRVSGGDFLNGRKAQKGDRFEC